MKTLNGVTVTYVRSNEVHDIFKISGSGYSNNHFESYLRDTITESEILSAIAPNNNIGINGKQE